MTKGKKVLELPKDAKSAIKKFGPIRSLHCGHVTLNGGLCLHVYIYLMIEFFSQYTRTEGESIKYLTRILLLLFRVAQDTGCQNLMKLLSRVEINT